MSKHYYQCPMCEHLEMEILTALLSGSVDGVSNESVSGSENDSSSDWFNI